jgi:hypothetical protein
LILIYAEDIIPSYLSRIIFYANLSPIFLLGNVTHEDIDDFTKNGADMVIMKPLTIDSFKSAMSALIAKRNEGVVQVFVNGNIGNSSSSNSDGDKVCVENTEKRVTNEGGFSNIADLRTR